MRSPSHSLNVKSMEPLSVAVSSGPCGLRCSSWQRSGSVRELSDAIAGKKLISFGFSCCLDKKLELLAGVFAGNLL